MSVMVMTDMAPIEVRRDGEVICVLADESCLYSDEIIKDMKANGYKFYQDGKIYKPDKRNKMNKNIKAVMFVGEAKEITTICI